MVHGPPAGQDRFETLGRVFYRGTDVCILVYDITDPKSLESLAKWKELYLEAQPRQDDNTIFCVFGNKVHLSAVSRGPLMGDTLTQADLEAKRLVSTRQAEEWCHQQGDMPHYLVSAKEGLNIDQAIDRLVKEAVARADAGPLIDPWPEVFHLPAVGTEKPRSSCAGLCGGPRLDHEE